MPQLRKRLEDKLVMFKNPPLVETVLGVQFSPLDVRAVHLALFWPNLKKRGFSLTEEHPPLPHAIETKDQPIGFLNMMLTLKQPTPRLWFLTPPSDLGQSLVQLQPDQFIQNWRRKDVSGERYPSYETNRAEFKALYEEFSQLVQDEKLGNLQPDQCEVTYVNRIQSEPGRPLGPLAIEIKPEFAHISGEPDTISLGTSYWVDSLNGRLSISAQTAVLQSSGEKFLVFRIQARGAPKTGTLDGLLDWLDSGHYNVVKTFEKLTTTDAHKIWGIET